MTVQITLPWPDKRVMPNAKRKMHWTTYILAERADRHAGFILTCSAVHPQDRKAIAAGDGKIPMRVTFVPPDKRHRDDDGMIGAFKHLRDGIADALRTDDRRFAPSYHFAPPQSPGRVEIVIGETGE